DGFLSDLHQNFLAFLEQVADQRDRRILAARKTTSASTAALAVARTPLALAVITRTRTRRALRVASGARRRPNFYSGIDSAVAAGLGVENGFRLGLRLFEFEFLSILFAFG